MKTHEKIIILFLFIILASSGFLSGFWLGGGFNNQGNGNIEAIEQANNERIAELQTIENGLREQLESERSQRESLDRIIKSERETNQGLRIIIDSYEKQYIQTEGRISEDNERIESIIQRLKLLQDSFNH